MFKSTDNITDINSRSAKLNALYTIYKLEMELVVNISYQLNNKYIEKDVVIKTWKIAQHKDVARVNEYKSVASDSILVGNIFNKYKEYNSNFKNESDKKIYSNNTYNIIDNAIEREFKYKFNNSIPSHEFKKDIIEFIENSFKESFVELMCNTGCMTLCVKAILTNLQ